MAVERYGSKTDVVIKLILVFFISLLSFSIGTFVGKKFSDSQHKLAQLEPGSSEEASVATDEREVASIPSESTEESPSKPLSDSEISKLAEEFVTDDVEEAPHAPSEIAKHGESKAEQTPSKEEHTAEKPVKETKSDHNESTHAQVDTHKAETTQPSKAALRLAVGQSPSEKVVEKKSESNRIPSSLPKEVAASSIGKFTIQIASYPDEAEAQKLAEQLKSKKLEAFYVPAKVKGKTFYRVNIGLYSSSKEAKSELDKVAKLTSVSTPIIQKIASE